uniref:Uncharacterized protein n=1 Tax=Timema shepardi TaxID=629360 RepID=A0A7R9AXN3_TIMSH|nr:unnamed protein product [Timema shepardi]
MNDIEIERRGVFEEMSLQYLKGAEEPISNSSDEIMVHNITNTTSHYLFKSTLILYTNKYLYAQHIEFTCLLEQTCQGAVSYVMYRRHYLNKPQTLNDKCSNQDSSCYIDDSTLRENSEEMYSLDNDSFLNSLEAMTIQNYWTDSVKHTKL